MLEAALPYVRSEARCSIVTRMKDLTTIAVAGDLVLTDARQLHRETVATIRAALPAAQAIDQDG
jgi:hypothetical protein